MLLYNIRYNWKLFALAETKSFLSNTIFILYVADTNGIDLKVGTIQALHPNSEC